MSRPRIIGLLLFLITLGAYLPVLRDGFVNYDDPDYVTENPMVKQGLTGPGFKWAFNMWHASNWHPLTWLSHMADCEVFRLNPAGHHLVNLVLHALNVVLLFTLWWRLTRALWPAAFIAALFGWHPLHVESVAWVSERKDVLSTFFALLTLLFYAAYARRQPCKIHSDPTSLPSYGPYYRDPSYWLAFLFFACSLMSKPMLVTMPFLLLLLDCWPLHRSQGFIRLGLEKWPFALLSAASCAVTILAQRQEAIASLSKCPLGLRLENVVLAYAGYLQKTILPVKLAVFYPLPATIPWPQIVLSGLVLVAVSLGVWSARRWPWLLAGWLWYLGTLIPVIGLVQVGDQSMADRYTYFPLIGIFFAVAFIIPELAARFHCSNAVLALSAAIMLAACLGLTENQLTYWRSSETLFLHAVSVTHDNALAHLNLGEAYQEEQRSAEALTQYHEVLRLSPAREEAYNNIARLLNDQGRPAAALEYCRAAVRLHPSSPGLHVSLGIVLSELNRFDEAQAEFSEALRLDADNVPAHFQAARTFLKQGNDVAALPHLRAALRLDPDDVTLLIFTARVLAADPNAAARDGGEALTLARHAAQIAGGNQFVILDTLAMAGAEVGQFEAAVQAGRQALQLAQAAGQDADAAALQQRLALYQKNLPWRESFLK